MVDTGSDEIDATPGVMLYAFRQMMKWNLPIDPVTNVTAYVADFTNQLVSQLAPYELSFIKVPVLFEQDVRFDEPDILRFYAGSANLVNCLNIPGAGVFMSDPGCEAFRNYTTNHVSDVHWVEVWEYHRLLGEIHCGSATRRTIDLSTPWWQQFPNWE